MFKKCLAEYGQGLAATFINMLLASICFISLKKTSMLTRIECRFSRMKRFRKGRLLLSIVVICRCFGIPIIICIHLKIKQF